MPKVSVIVPVYNVENYIEKCLNSLVKQTLQDIEIIIVNDGSKDNSETIIKKYLHKYPEKIKYYAKENGGLSDARNFGLKYVTADYVAFLDSDDYVELDLYEKMYNIAIKEDSDFVECNFIWKYDNKEKIDRGVIYNNKNEMFITARVVAWNKLIKTSLILDNNMQFPKGLRYEDVEFFYKLLPYIKKFSFVKEPLIYYVQRNNSISNTQNERTKEIFNVLDNVINYYKKNNIYEKYMAEIEYNYARYTLCSSLFRMVKIKNRDVRKELLNYSWNNLNSKFPEWKKNRYLNNVKNGKNIYMKTINKFTFKIYCVIFRILQYCIIYTQ